MHERISKGIDSHLLPFPSRLFHAFVVVVVDVALVLHLLLEKIETTEWSKFLWASSAALENLWENILLTASSIAFEHKSNQCVYVFTVRV